MSDNRSTWTSRIGFILASAGAAIGLGAIWKFPYLAGSNGGSVFMFPYILLSFTIGLTLLIAEVGLGRTGKGCIVTTYRTIAGRRSSGASCRARRSLWAFRRCSSFSPAGLLLLKSAAASKSSPRF